MDFLRRIEDDVRNLSVESRRKHPEVREAAEKALHSLRSMRESYASEVMRGAEGSRGRSDSEVEDENRPKIAKFRSAEVTAPYILVCNGGVDVMPVKLVKLALNGIQILLNYEVVPPCEATSILRVLLVQSNSTSADVQLKVLQIVLQLANALAADPFSNQYLTVDNVREMLQLSLQLCISRPGNTSSSSSTGFGSSYYSSIMGGSASTSLPSGAANVAVGSTAFATVRQILALIMDATVENFAAHKEKNGVEKDAPLSLCAEMFVKDLSLFTRRKAGQWLDGIVFEFSSALDLLFEVLSGWPNLFMQQDNFQSLFKHAICPAILPLLESLPTDYIEAYKHQQSVAAGHSESLSGSSSGGVGINPASYIAGKDGSAASTVRKIVRIARCILLQFPRTDDFLPSIESMTNLMLHVLQPDRECDMLLKTLPTNVLDGTVAGGGTVLVDGSISHSLVMITGGVTDQAEQISTAAALSSISGMGSGNASNSAPTPSLISRLTNPSKQSQQTKEQIAYFSRTTSGGLVLPLGTSSNYSYSYIRNVMAGQRGTSPVEGVLALNASNVPNFNYISAHPAAACLEAVLSFLLFEDDMCVHLVASDSGEAFLTNVFTSVILSVTSTLAEALMIDANIRDFEIISKNSPIVPLVEDILSQSNDDSWDCSKESSTYNAHNAKQNRSSLLKTLRDLLFCRGSLTSGDVLLLSFLTLQVTCRRLVQCSLLVSDLDRKWSHGKSGKSNASSRLYHDIRSKIFPASSDGGLVRTPFTVSEACNEGDVHLLAERMQRSLVATYERTGNKINEACTALLCRCNGDHFENNMNVSKRTLNMLAEASLSCGLLGLQRQGDVLISTLCRFTVPRWQTQDAVPPPPELARDGSSRDSLVGRDSASERDSVVSVGRNFIQLKRRHIQCFVRLTQVVHVLADVINDWDVIMDCFEQIMQILIANHRVAHAAQENGGSAHVEHSDALSLNDTEKIFQCIERFKGYTVFMSDETIVKLMTSLVALSVNSLSMASSVHVSEQVSNLGSQSQKGSSQDNGDSSDNNAVFIAMKNYLKRNLTGSDYMIEALGSGYLNCSLHMAVEIVKINAFRVSCIWQMATSHLRILASHSMARTRVIAVAATNDIITTTLDYMRNPSVDVSYTKKMVLLESNSDSSRASAEKKKRIVVPSWADYLPCFFVGISDIELYEEVLPPYQTTFMGRPFQESLLKSRAKSSGLDAGANSHRLLLTQADLLSSLRGLANIKFDDVRTDVMQGLLEMLQGGGQAVTGGWGIIIELLTAVPASLVPHADDDALENDNQDVLCDEAHEVQQSSDVSSSRWPVQALLTAFSCLTLIVDDFLETLRDEDSNSLGGLVSCLAMFSRQSFDVNISLTSVQMLWKVTDFVMTTSRKQGDEKTTTEVLNVMLQQLLELSLDLRPEIRNCATNTLFSAIVSNATMLSGAQWRKAFQDVIFPLFLRAETRSSEAMRSKEQALAPEIKKGVKMTVHHTRDTAHKQWSETRIFALRGLSRVMKICLKTLLGQSWFQDTWLQALELCIGAVQSDWHTGGQELGQDLEVSLAGVDTIFEFVKMVSSSSNYKAKTRAAQGMRVVGGALVSDQPSHGPSTTDSSSSDHLPHGVTAVCDSETAASREVAQQSLWQLAWSAVKVASCFSSPGWDLPLHICKHLREVYVGGTEAEFRYSKNIQSLLDIVVVLARPRVPVSVERKSDATGCCSYTLIDDAPKSGGGIGGVRMGAMTAAQLHKAIMDMLKSVHPKDMASFSCLVTCISEMCFHGQYYTQLPNVEIDDQRHHPSTGNIVDHSDIAGGDAVKHRRVVFAPVEAKLREEVEGYMLAMLRGAPEADESTKPMGSANPAKSSKIIRVEPFFIPSPSSPDQKVHPWHVTALQILAREFVSASCQPGIHCRTQYVLPIGVAEEGSGSYSCQSSHSVDLVNTPPPPRGVTRKGKDNKGRGSFLVSLAKIMSLSIEYEEDDEVRSELVDEERQLVGDGSAWPSVMRLRKLCVLSDSNTFENDVDNEAFDDQDDDVISTLGDKWERFVMSESTLQVLTEAMQLGLPGLLSVGCNCSVSNQRRILNDCLVVASCCASPWLLSKEMKAMPRVTDDGSGLTLPTSLSSFRQDVLLLPDSMVTSFRNETDKGSPEKFMSSMLAAVASHVQALLMSDAQSEWITTLEAWVHILVHSSQLLCWVLHDMMSGQVLNQEQATVGTVEDNATISYFIITMKQLHLHLLELLQWKECPTTIKMRALCGSHQVISTLASCSTPPDFAELYESPSSSATVPVENMYIPSSKLHELCSSFLEHLLAIDTSMHELPGGPIPPPPESLYACLCLWVHDSCHVLSNSPPLTSKQSAKLHQILTKSSLSQSVCQDKEYACSNESCKSPFIPDFGGKGHLFLLFDVCTRLVVSDYAPLRRVAMRTMRAVDTSRLLSAYKDNMAKVDSLQNRCLQLSSELSDIKSASSFQF